MRFNRFASLVMRATGSPYAFLAALGLIAAWACFGPLYKWNAVHSLFINTVTTCITFAMVFIIQYSQNKDTKAMQIKLDELVKATKDADDQKIGIENLTHEELKNIKV